MPWHTDGVSQERVSVAQRKPVRSKADVTKGIKEVVVTVVVVEEKKKKIRRRRREGEVERGNLPRKTRTLSLSRLPSDLPSAVR